MALLDRLLRRPDQDATPSRPDSRVDRVLDAWGSAWGSLRASAISLSPLDRLDARTALVTLPPAARGARGADAASRSAGLAIAAELVSRGAHVILAADERADESADDVRRGAHGLATRADALAGKPGTLEALAWERSSPASLRSIVDELAEDLISLDVLVLTDGGADDALFVRLLLARGVIANGVFAERFEDDDVDDARRFRPRVVLAHRPSARDDEGLREDLDGWASTLAGRLAPRGEVEVAVHGFHPSDTAERARSAPLVDRVLALRSPRAADAQGAARDAVWLACARPIEGETRVEVRDGRRLPERRRARGASDEAAFDRVERSLSKWLEP